MGSKLAARELMIAAGVPVLPGIDVSGHADGDLDAAVVGVGRPMIVKASFGGGGRGMRLVREGDDLVAAVQSARREAASAFGNDTVFVERYVERPRHIEVQVLADAHGTTVHLFERECSIQRRHQKIIEESPSPFVDDAMRAAMGEAAVRAAAAVGYVGAGTVEFVVDPSGQFFFLEMNTRLQVEHPVTELVTGLDLVRLQLLVASGSPLPAEVLTARIDGHAIEARLYAEDPMDDHRPAPGRLQTFALPAGPGLRVDSGVESGSHISPHYDPMIAKVVAHGATRDEARRRLAWALRRASLHGVVTNRDLLVGILEQDEFASGDIDTAFLDRHPAAELARSRIDADAVRDAVVAAAFASAAAARLDAPVLRAVPAGWRNNRAQLITRAFVTPLGPMTVGYASGRAARIEIDGEPVAVEVVHAAPERVELLAAGIRRSFTVTFGDEDGSADAGTVYVDSPQSNVTLKVQPRFPATIDDVAAGSLLAPMPGTIVRVEVKEGARVVAGQPLVVIEAMKMEHQVLSPADGSVSEVRVEVGQAVDAGAVLVVVEAESVEGAAPGEAAP
jgi:acetyl/propionyl-CoA carboxylase alpha subunit